MGGFRNAKIYPIQGSNYAKAKALDQAARAATRAQRRRTASTRRWAQALGQVFAELRPHVAGLQREREAVPGLPGLRLHAGQKGADFDAAVIGWNQDYPDPYDFLDILLNGNNIHDNNNNNLAYFNNTGDQPEARARRTSSSATRATPAYGSSTCDDHEELRAVGVLRQPQRARVHRGTRRRLPVPAGERERRPEHAVHQVGSHVRSSEETWRRLTGPAPLRR